MSVSHRVFFELQREPFTSDIQREEILVTDGLAATEKRIHYAMRIGGIAVLTGEIGSGKSTALRYVTESLHPSQYLCLYVTATTGSILELYRQILDQLGVDNRGSSRARMCQTIRRHVSELSQGKKLQVLLTVDEASLLRMEVFAELHTLLQFEKDAKPFLPLVMAGQNNLLDSLAYRPAMPLASRVVARSHLEGVNRQQMQNYIVHHLAIAGVSHSLFDDNAVTAIHQGSGGLFRKANHLARGSLIVAAQQKSSTVTAEHVRLAATAIHQPGEKGFFGIAFGRTPPRSTYQSTGGNPLPKFQ
jgi:type II secretory pathway predicted ATPase ExeA